LRQDVAEPCQRHDIEVWLSEAERQAAADYQEDQRQRAARIAERGTTQQ
jgi:hypothetical protein